MPEHFLIRPDEWDARTLYNLVEEDMPVSLSREVTERVRKTREYLDRRLENDDSPVYGINTGFGSLYNVKIPKDQLHRLQENLVMSHACGTGEEVPRGIAKLMLLLKIKSLSYGHSGIRIETLERLVFFYNNGVIPVVYRQGSLGASGDLAPLAHLSLPLIGKGEVYFRGRKIPAEAVHEELGIKPLQLHSKEGLALLNGTQFMSAYAVFLLLKSFKYAYLADLIGSLSLDAFDGRLEPFDELIHRIRPHRGQLTVAKRVRDFLAGSELVEREKHHVQDPYSFRCIPQVHGATRDTLDFVMNTVLTEVNSVTDNPNIFPAENRIISGGNFHGQPLALALDYLGIAMSELGNISERRTYQLISGRRELPPFLVAQPGINSGLMIPQYTAASMVSINKQFATPSSTDSIVSSNGQEDHVSMGANAAIKAYSVVQNVRRIIAIELLTAAQALHFRKPARTSEFLERFVEKYREAVPFIREDRELHLDIQKSLDYLSQYRIDPEILFE